jgi:hypothetical protein
MKNILKEGVMTFRLDVGHVPGLSSTDAPRFSVTVWDGDKNVIHNGQIGRLSARLEDAVTAIFMECNKEV